ncbi:28552_t:CDS:2, partial [Racocetra persica]
DTLWIPGSIEPNGGNVKPGDGIVKLGGEPGRNSTIDLFIM